MHNRPDAVSLMGRRTRRQLVEMLLRAHRHGDAALVRLCQAELDLRSRACIAAGPRRSVRRAAAVR
jgi:hypothetical protein